MSIPSLLDANVQPSQVLPLLLFLPRTLVVLALLRVDVGGEEAEQEAEGERREMIV